MIIPFLMCVFWALIRDLQFEDQDSENCKWVFPTRENSESAKHARRPRRRASQKVQLQYRSKLRPNENPQVHHAEAYQKMRSYSLLTFRGMMAELNLVQFGQ
ncbi:unnamed protein product [Sphagnum troendelagicum]|jgi:hypothetical protein|uniref:Uncharacterized protein n=1 Tax=Sphagnum troendelagicum TaxID=128251 RepID=A0ABP0UV77_9BRYO